MSVLDAPELAPYQDEPKTRTPAMGPVHLQLPQPPMAAVTSGPGSSPVNVPVILVA